MPWSTSDRRAHLPADWEARRRQVRARAGGKCEHKVNGLRCSNAGTECHHLGDRDDHRLEMLQWICADCHKQETKAQAKEAQRSKYVTARKRTPEAHPGIRHGH